MKHTRIRFQGQAHDVLVSDDGTLTTGDGRGLSANEVEWLPPEPSIVIGLALNYADHAAELDFSKLPGARQLADAHAGYIVAITRALLDEAVDATEIGPIDTAALALVLGRLGREFSRPEVEKMIRHSSRETADSIAEIILDGLISRQTS